MVRWQLRRWQLRLGLHQSFNLSDSKFGDLPAVQAVRISDLNLRGTGLHWPRAVLGSIRNPVLDSNLTDAGQRTNCAGHEARNGSLCLYD
jgi:hypothetical protein